MTMIGPLINGRPAANRLRSRLKALLQPNTPHNRLPYRWYMCLRPAGDSTGMYGMTPMAAVAVAV